MELLSLPPDAAGKIAAGVFPVIDDGFGDRPDGLLGWAADEHQAAALMAQRFRVDGIPWTGRAYLSDYLFAGERIESAWMPLSLED